jgi:hypothetical protein
MHAAARAQHASKLHAWFSFNLLSKVYVFRVFFAARFALQYEVDCSSTISSDASSF